MFIKSITIGSILLMQVFVVNNLFAQNNAIKEAKPKAVLNHTAIYVVDLKKSGDFYHNIIGLDTIPEPFHDNAHIWMKTSPYSSLHIILGADKFKDYYKNQHTCYTVPNFRAFIEKLQQTNWTWEDVSGKKNAITTRVDGVHQIWLQDPDGYWLEINDDTY